MKVHDTVQEAVIKTIPNKKAKWLTEEALQIAEKRKDTHLNAEFQRIARKDKAFLSDQCKDIETKQ